jgi:hypothetical protein
MDENEISLALSDLKTLLDHAPKRMRSRPLTQCLEQYEEYRGKLLISARIDSNDAWQIAWHEARIIQHIEHEIFALFRATGHINDPRIDCFKRTHAKAIENLMLSR